jgi:hypothetical protein
MKVFPVLCQCCLYGAMRGNKIPAGAKCPPSKGVGRGKFQMPAAATQLWKQQKDLGSGWGLSFCGCRASWDGLTEPLLLFVGCCPASSQLFPQRVSVHVCVYMRVCMCVGLAGDSSSLDALLTPWWDGLPVHTPGRACQLPCTLPPPCPMWQPCCPHMYSWAHTNTCKHVCADTHVNTCTQTHIHARPHHMHTYVSAHHGSPE